MPADIRSARRLPMPPKAPNRQTGHDQSRKQGASAAVERRYLVQRLKPWGRSATLGLGLTAMLSGVSLATITVRNRSTGRRRWHLPTRLPFAGLLKMLEWSWLRKTAGDQGPV